MKKVTVLAALILAGIAQAQDASHAGEVYVSGHTTKSGKWIDGYYRKRPVKRSAASAAQNPAGAATTPPTAAPPGVTPPRTSTRSTADPTVDRTEYVPGHFTKTHKWVEGHFRKPSHRIVKPKRETDPLDGLPTEKLSRRKKSTGPFGS